jgi:hypothetical protein
MDQIYSQMVDCMDDRTGGSGTVAETGGVSPRPMQLMEGDRSY